MSLLLLLQKTVRIDTEKRNEEIAMLQDLQEISDGKIYGCNDMVRAACGDCAGCHACCCLLYTSVQNSVFECIVDQTQYVILKKQLKDIIDVDKDSVRYYVMGEKYKSLSLIHI